MPALIGPLIEMLKAEQGGCSFRCFSEARQAADLNRREIVESRRGF